MPYAKLNTGLMTCQLQGSADFSSLTNNFSPLFGRWFFLNSKCLINQSLLVHLLQLSQLYFLKRQRSLWSPRTISSSTNQQLEHIYQSFYFYFLEKFTSLFLLLLFYQNIFTNLGKLEHKSYVPQTLNILPKLCILQLDTRN